MTCMQKASSCQNMSSLPAASTATMHACMRPLFQAMHWVQMTPASHGYVSMQHMSGDCTLDRAPGSPNEKPIFMPCFHQVRKLPPGTLDGGRRSFEGRSACIGRVERPLSNGGRQQRHLDQPGA